MARTNVTDIAAKRLQEMIQSGELPPDQQLPSQLALSEQLGISRASLREALSTLETLGFLRIEPGRGTFVATANPTKSGQLAARAIGGRYAKQDVYQTRLYLESLVVAELVTAVTDADLSALNEATTLMCEAWERQDLVTVINHDRTFHHTLWQICPNALLRDLCFGLAEEFSATRSYPLPATREARFKASANEHFALVDAIAQRQTAQAVALMQRHIFNTAAAAGIDLHPLTDRGASN